MANGLYEENDIQDIAEAIREQNGTAETYNVSEMGDAIRSLGTPIDSKLSTTSTNPVQNKIVTEKLNEIDGTLEELTPLHNMNGCIVCNGESVTLTVGEDIEAGQVITFKYLLSKGYSIGWTAPDSFGIPSNIQPVMANGYSEESITIDGTKTTYSFKGCYFVIVKPISNTVKEKLNQLEDSFEISDELAAKFRPVLEAYDFGAMTFSEAEARQAMTLDFPDSLKSNYSIIVPIICEVGNGYYQAVISSCDNNALSVIIHSAIGTTISQITNCIVRFLCWK